VVKAPKWHRTSQVPVSIPHGNKFPDWVKKNPLASPHAKAQVQALSSCGYGGDELHFWVAVWVIGWRRIWWCTVSPMTYFEFRARFESNIGDSLKCPRPSLLPCLTLAACNCPPNIDLVTLAVAIVLWCATSPKGPAGCP
jgi:hypothetical protein